MSAKDKFVSSIYRYVSEIPHPLSFPSVVIAGGLDYDGLFTEVSTSIADFMSCDQTAVSLELQRKGVAHFYYRGILVIRSPVIQEGFFLA